MLARGPKVKSVVVYKNSPSPAKSHADSDIDDENIEVFSDAIENLSPNAALPVKFTEVPQTSQKIQMKKRNLSVTTSNDSNISESDLDSNISEKSNKIAKNAHKKSRPELLQGKSIDETSSFTSSKTIHPELNTQEADEINTLVEKMENEATK